MLEQELMINSKDGLHARPASLFVAEAAKFSGCTVKVVFGEKIVNAKSIMSVLSLGVIKGSMVKIQIEGDFAEQAMQAMVNLCENVLNKE
ncbi:MAG: HPr family phosphocarrier protein [Clostridia bacterium]